ncbi:MAG: hypothetical protein CFK48_08975 [Armatimonadetes bacterium CP1_7O]|nr:MAG: hypothetical protein CFK48_08975 [Armatimonadetes bacterium CP1_7O]
MKLAGTGTAPRDELVAFTPKLGRWGLGQDCPSRALWWNHNAKKTPTPKDRLGTHERDRRENEAQNVA